MNRRAFLLGATAAVLCPNAQAGSVTESAVYTIPSDMVRVGSRAVFNTYALGYQITVAKPRRIRTTSTAKFTPRSYARVVPAPDDMTLTVIG